MSLQDLVRESAARRPDAVAVRGPDGAATYGELDALANRAARALRALGVGPGDRVGLWLDKSVRAVAAMQGALRLGAAYVPVDPLGPPRRAAAVLRDCAVRAVVASGARAAALRADGALAGVGWLVVDDDDVAGGAAGALPWGALAGMDPGPLGDGPAPAGGEALAYVLYTSGSTGAPKGVCVTHRAALAFVRWVAAELAATAADRFANHAPWHFDLSVLDLYAAFLAGATVALVPDGAAYAPRQLVAFLDAEGITVWYSVPSALVLMMEHGGLLDAPPAALRAVLFAGEPFPVKHLRRLRERLPRARLLNLYGPTETNVCTFHEVRAPDLAGTEPVPIGRACCGNRVWAVRPDGREAAPGEEGELVVSGPTVMAGYWGREPQGDRPYATGDVVRRLDADTFAFVGRRDAQVKLRGHRVELGEVEAALADHPAVREAAAAVVGTGLAARLVAFVVCAGEPPPLLEFKRHCAERLPRSMIVDEVRALAALPRTRNGKLDRRALARVAAGGEVGDDAG